jgi:hypothetical protein
VGVESGLRWLAQKVTSVIVDRLASHQRSLAGIHRMMRSDRERIAQLERELRAVEQAILEIAAALRRSGLLDGFGALSLPPSNPDRQSADPRSTIQP